MNKLTPTVIGVILVLGIVSFWPAEVPALTGTINEQVLNTANDAFETGNGIMTLDATRIQWRDDDSASANKYWIAARFASSNFPPKGSTITSCYVEWYPVTVSFNTNHNIHLELAESPAVFTTAANNISSRTLTSNFTSWTGTNLGGGIYLGSTVNLTSACQEVANAFTPTAMVVVAKPRGGADYNAYVQDLSGGANSAKLHIEYTEPIPVANPSDTTPPAISNVASSNVSNASAQITWTTNELSTSQVEYGLSASYGSLTATDASFITSHSVSLAGLSSGTLYHFRIKSKDASGNEALSPDYTFTTPAPPTVGWPGWDSITAIYYNPAQDNADDKFMEQAAAELKDHLLKAGKTLAINTGSKPVAGSIYFEVDSGHPELASKNSEAFKLYADSNGVYITGKTPIAVRQGVYTFLEKLGFRWFYKYPIWTIYPKTLISLDNLNEVQEPFYTLREVAILNSINPGDDYSAFIASDNYISVWQKRNKGYGATFLPIQHSYAEIIGRSEYGAHPEWFLPDNRYPSYPWQLRPDNSGVVARAIEFARTFLKQGSLGTSVGKLPVGAVPISPNDGGGWDPPWPLSSTQLITDKVFYLANEVAKAIKSEFPGKYVSLYMYGRNTEIPSFNLEPNIMVQIATAYNYGSLSLAQQISGMKAKGVVVGIRDYMGVWNWSKDSPAFNLNLLKQLAWYAVQGIKIYKTESYDGWGGGTGLANYLATKLLWNPNLSIDSLLDDFYTKAFGPAKVPMKKYFENRNTTKEALKVTFEALDEAERLASGDNEILERIRYQQYHNRYVWFWKNVGLTNLSLEKLKGFYTFNSRIRNLYVVLNRGVEPALRKELQIRGLTDPEINALQNFTLPTAGEARVWLDEALAEFTSVVIVPPEISSINPIKTTLAALGDAAKPKLVPFLGMARQIIVPSSGSEDVNVLVKGSSGTVQWYGPTGLLLESYSVSSLADWTPVKFRADLAGNYVIHVTRTQPTGSNGVSVDVPDRPASMLADPDTKIFEPEEWLDMDAPVYQGKNEAYFYVPSGTNVFIFGADITNSPEKHTTGKLTDPNNIEYAFDFGATAEKRFDSPAAGLWKIEINSTVMYRHFWLRGIPPLIWHDPKYLLVQAGASTPPPPPPPPPGTYAISSTDRLHLFRDKAGFLKISGSNFNLNTNFSIQFLQNSSAVSSFTFQPKDASTLELNLTFVQLNALPVGFYNLKIVRTTDSVSQTYAKQILVTQSGDLWSQTTTETSEQKRDGKVNIYDASRLLSRWGSANSADLQEYDISSGPGDVSRGKIDLYDANLLMRNWRP